MPNAETDEGIVDLGIADSGGADLRDAASGGDDLGPDGSVDVGAEGCSEANLDGCEWPRGNGMFVERDGLEVTDAATGRVLPILARIPQGTGPFPVVVYSHGGGFNNNGHRFSVEWGTVLARHGFVVVHVAHVAPTQDTATAMCQLASIPDTECVPTMDEESGLVAVARAFDLAAILDRIPDVAAWTEANGGPSLDVDHVALMGWSGGTRGPMINFGAAMRPYPGSAEFTRPHALPVAGVYLSPTGPGFGGFFDDGAADSWDAFRGPSMFITGENDVKVANPGLTGPIRRTPYELASADGNRWLLYSNLPEGVGGHDTYSLGDVSTAGEQVTRLHRAMVSASLAFLDAYLRESAEAAAWLATSNAAVLAGDVDWEHK